MIYNADSLLRNWPEACVKGGRYVLARPVSGPFIWRVKASWLVLIGKCDALKWTEQ